MGEPNQPRDYHGRFTHGLVDSLEQQLVAKGSPNVHALAVEILAAQGSVDPKTGELTARGRERELLGREGRAKDRLATQTGHKPEHLVYDKRQRKAFVK